MIAPDVQIETGHRVGYGEFEDLVIAPHGVDRNLMTFTELLDHSKLHARLPPRSPLDVAILRFYFVGIVDRAFRVQLFKDFIEQGLDVPLLELSSLFSRGGYLMRDTSTVRVIQGFRHTAS